MKRLVLCGVTIVCLAFSSLALAATQTSGQIHIYVVSHDNGANIDIITGAITDYGTDHSVGTKFEKIVLSKGSFEVSTAKFNASYRQHIGANCAVTGSLHAAGLPLLNGTGAYAGIKGTVSLKAVFVAIATTRSGKCNTKVKPIAAQDSLSGSGSVSY